MKPTIIERVRAYLARLPISVSGSGGHAAAFNAALVLVKGFNLGEQDAFTLLSEWNSQCLPPWNDSDLRHKLKSAGASDKPSGYLVASDDQQRHHTTPDHETEAEKKARYRRTWPEFKPLRKAGVETIAKLRGIDIDAVDLAHRVGLLRGAMIDDHPSFIVTEGTFAQARRLDGQPFEKSDGTKIKAKNLPGSEGAFVGRSWLYDAPHVLLVEGCIGLVEGMAAVLPVYVNTEEPWGVIAATSASSRFSRDPALLAYIRGRHVRIIPDNDQAGMDAAASWLADLEGVGARVEVISLPDGIKDIGDLLTHPATTAETLTHLFK